MTLTPQARTGLAATLLLAFALLAAPALAANQYAAVRTINGAVITSYDVDQRTRFLEALGATGNLRDTALTQLTEDRLKVQSGKANGIELPEDAVAAGVEEFATQRGITADDVWRVLDARNIDHQTMNDFVEAGLMWREVVGARFRARAVPTDKDIDDAITAEMNTPRQVLHMSEIALPFEERGQEETMALARRLHDSLSRGADFAAVVREYSRSASAQRGGTIDPMPADNLPPAIRAQVLPLRPGQVSQPIPITGGVALLKLNSITREAPPEVDPKDPAVREAVRTRLFGQRITTFGQGYLQELMGDALVIER